MLTKFEGIIKLCQSEVPISCNKCACDERECLVSILNKFNETCEEEEMINCDDFN